MASAICFLTVGTGRPSSCAPVDELRRHYTWTWNADLLLSTRARVFEQHRVQIKQRHNKKQQQQQHYQLYAYLHRTHHIVLAALPA